MCYEQPVRMYCRNREACVYWGDQPFENYFRDIYCREGYRTGIMCYATPTDETRSWRDTCKQCQIRAAEEQAVREQVAQEQAAQEKADQEQAAQEHAAQEQADQEHAAQEHAAQEHANGL